MKKRIFGEVIASLESGERMEREAANSASLRELRRNNQARGVVCTPRAWMCLNGGALERIFEPLSSAQIGLYLCSKNSLRSSFHYIGCWRWKSVLIALSGKSRFLSPTDVCRGCG